ncbi:MAG: hypothetical protein LUI87_02165 [Lachnospiraceae bacterium]|nr:hypothetical protein [Lachnospiraceae bacterium]
MFLKTSGFKRLLKEAYKGRGLHIGGTENTTILAGSYWAIEVFSHEIPKEKLAAIIELFGRLPNPGERWLLTKDGAQSELDIYDDYRAMENIRGLPVKTNYTRLLISTGGGTFRVLQAGNGRIDLIDETVREMISQEEIQPGHGKLKGPFLNGREDRVFFSNDNMALQIFPTRPSPTGHSLELFEYLEAFDLNGEDNGPDVPEEDSEEEEEEDA